MTKREQIRNLFFSGQGIDAIAKTLGITRQAIYAHKRDDLKNGVDWDEMALIRARDEKELRADENRFLLTLIRSFDEALNELGELDANARLETLQKYANIYYKLKVPLNSDIKAKAAAAVTNAVNAIADIASEHKNTAVTDFLAKNADEILKRAFNG